MKRLRVLTILGTRPEIIRLSRVLPKMDSHLDHIVVYTSQSYSYELSTIFFEELGLREPDYTLSVKADTVGKQIANIIEQTEEVILKEMPEALLILGDTNSALSAINAKRLKIPVFHMEAGNRCFDENVPEELNRRIVDHISDINLPYTEHSRKNLLLEGIHPGSIFVTGSPLAEVLDYYEDAINSSQILEKLDLHEKEYFLVSTHREENVIRKEALCKLFKAFGVLARTYSFPLIVSTHPRTRQKIEEYGIDVHPQIKLQDPMGLFDYVYLQKNAFCVLSDSGTLPEESAILGFPAVQIRTSSERPEAFDAGTILLSGLDSSIILQSVEIVTKEFEEGFDMGIPSAYRERNVSDKVLKIVSGYAEIVKDRIYGS